MTQPREEKISQGGAKNPSGGVLCPGRRENFSSGEGRKDLPGGVKIHRGGYIAPGGGCRRGIPWTERGGWGEACVIPPEKEREGDRSWERREYENNRQYVAAIPSLGFVLALLSPTEQAEYLAKVVGKEQGISGEESAGGSDPPSELESGSDEGESMAIGGKNCPGAGETFPSTVGPFIDELVRRRRGEEGQSSKGEGAAKGEKGKVQTASQQ